MQSPIYFTPSGQMVRLSSLQPSDYITDPAGNVWFAAWNGSGYSVFENGIAQPTGFAPDAVMFCGWWQVVPGVSPNQVFFFYRLLNGWNIYIPGGGSNPFTPPFTIQGTALNGAFNQSSVPVTTPWWRNPKTAALIQVDH